MAAIKMDELLVSWLASDDVYEKVLNLIETNRSLKQNPSMLMNSSAVGPNNNNAPTIDLDLPPPPPSSHRKATTSTVIPPFYTPNEGGRGRGKILTDQKWNHISDKVIPIFQEFGSSVPAAPTLDGQGQQGQGTELSIDHFVKITKEICGFPSFFNGPLYRRILFLYHQSQHSSSSHYPQQQQQQQGISLPIFKWFWENEMQNYDNSDRFFRLVKNPDRPYITKDDFLPYIEELLACHPGLEFLSNHAEFQEKYAITVITRIFYSVNTCHNGKITARQIRRSDLLESFHNVDREEDINKITRYFSYEHFYVLYCRFWELDHDRDYRITREDLLKYSEYSLSHMIVDRIFDAAPRPFDSSLSSATAGNNNANNSLTNQNQLDLSNDNQMNLSADNSNADTNGTREYLSYEDFIYFMLSEEDKSNEISVRYWFTCIDVDGDGKLNNMEMRSFYAVQLNRMQCLGHEIIPFEDMLCQMIDMIKPKTQEYLVVEDFLQAECSQVSGALFDALFNLNKYLQFEQRDPFMERQKREDEFESDWDRFAYIDYNRLAMEEEAREEEAMEIDWVTVEDEEEEGDEFDKNMASEAPF
eukprot:CAMPEP_0178962478 /NCGR_PEP_ID=MMETSP0789-20121207/14388_1 /TAXON_ID=3005 /ORGANISM="Rhizosolenia setigera, Strain CCMP 1694" /LENGTH=586 /DNA_ID=CAMNT_0020646635 /DNA_START=287 /DNA_END=2047 /DNA_ORIENTATION=+